MSPRQISFLASHAEGVWSAQQQRHFHGKPFAAQATSSMPFYGTTAGEEARLLASAEARAASPSRSQKHRPNTLSFLDDPSPVVDECTAHEASETTAAARRPASSPSSASSSVSDDSSARPDMESASSPLTSEHSDLDADTPLVPFPNLDIKTAKKYRSSHYGTPEMPRGSANLPHRPTRGLSHNRRVAPVHVKHLPRAEKLPLTGYELLASQLSAHGGVRRRRRSTSAASMHSTGSGNSSPRENTEGNMEESMESTESMESAAVGIRPLYRKFESLNHRILLHLQDELSELEEQLHRLDTADTQTRRLQSHIQPASRRAQAASGGELQWHKTDILGKIGYKLGQYNHVLSSFTETQRLAAPTPADVSAYRTYLATQQPIAEIETRFLDASDDLVTLATPPPHHNPHPHPHLHPQSHRRTESAPTELCASQPSLRAPPYYMPALRDTPVHVQQCPSPAPAAPAPTAPVPARASSLLHLFIAVAVAVIVPALTFSMIPTFAGRMAVVLLAAFMVFSGQIQQAEAAQKAQTALTDPTGEHARSSRRHTRDLVCCAVVYGAVMSVVACVCT